jgi:arylformamidase
MIYDISRTISTRIAVWPGDSPFHFQHNLRLEKGDSVNLTTMTLSPHTGTHADAYYHYEANGTHPAELPLHAYIGPATVVHVTAIDGPLTPGDFANFNLAQCERLLIGSHVSDLPDDVWPDQFPYLSVELIDWLAERKVVLIGLDSPSVDAFDSTKLPSHHAIYRHRMVNLENLCLKDVPADTYELIALPLKLDQVCGSPVRAILRPLVTGR